MIFSGERRGRFGPICTAQPVGVSMDSPGRWPAGAEHGGHPPAQSRPEPGQSQAEQRRAERRPGPHRLSLLDGLRLTLSGEHISIAARGQRLAALLALRGPQTRSMISGMLWPEVSEPKARTSVRAAVRDLHLHAPGLVVTTAFEVRLDPSVQVDVQEFLALARQLLAGVRPISVAEALELTPEGTLGGPLLPGWHDDWVVAEAERLHQLRLHSLDALVRQLVARAEYALALQVALAAVAVDPLRESTHRTAMQVHLAEGNTVEALRQYERFRVTLRAAMNIEPSQRMVDLVNEILRAGSPDPRLSVVAVKS